MTDKFYALNVNLFAFTLQSGLDLDLQKPIDESPQIFQETCEKLLKNNFSNKFDFSNSFPKFRQTFPDSDRYDLLESQRQGRQHFLAFSQAKNPNPTKPLYRLLLYPQKISDCYALLLNIFRPQVSGLDDVNLTEVSEFNPNQCLTLETEKNFIGQTLLITAYLPLNKPANPEALKPNAENLLNRLLGGICPDFYQAEEFLDSYILEFGNPKKSQTRYLVLFYFSDDTSEQLKKIYWDLPELFLYYHKIIHVFQMSRQSANEIDELIQKEIESQSTLPDTLDLEALKIQLKELLKILPKYTLQFRKLEYALNTINIHAGNYQRTLKRLQAQIGDNLDLFTHFVERESQIFQLQIQADLNYSKPGSQLLEQAIASVRGLVEIDQAESDRAAAQAEKINAQKLQNTIQAVGTGIGVGVGVAGILATSYPLIEKPWQLPSPQHPLLPPHPFIGALCLSFLGGILLGLRAWRITKSRLDKNLPNRSPSDSQLSGRVQTSLPSSQNQPIQLTSQQPETVRSPTSTP